MSYKGYYNFTGSFKLPKGLHPLATGLSVVYFKLSSSNKE